MSFALSNLLMAGALALAAAGVGYGATAWPGACRRLARDRAFGVVLAFLCLAWSAVGIQPMLEGGLAKFKPLLFVAVPVFTVVTYVYLDFLLARALGALLVLLAEYLIHAAFVANLGLPWRTLYDLMNYAMGLCGMCVVACPWYFRDLLEKITASAGWRRGTGLGLLLGALGYLTFAVVAWRTAPGGL